jgi:hypothetical protein
MESASTGKRQNANQTGGTCDEVASSQAAAFA